MRTPIEVSVAHLPLERIQYQHICRTQLFAALQILHQKVNEMPRQYSSLVGKKKISYINNMLVVNYDGSNYPYFYRT